MLPEIISSRGFKTGRKLGEFAKRASVHQPGEYARSVLTDDFWLEQPGMKRADEKFPFPKVISVELTTETGEKNSGV